MGTEETELRAAIRRILKSPSRKKLVVAGPGTGKTTLFKQMLKLAGGRPDRRLVLTFINNLRDDLEKELSGLAKVFTLHSYCLDLLHNKVALRAPLSSSFRCCPGLGHLIKEDWQHIKKLEAPHFISEMRSLKEENHIPFYLTRGNYYDAVDFDDIVYRVYKRLSSGAPELETYDLVLVDEYQDFNHLEVALVDCLAENSPILIVGDDDQALYSQLRDSSWDYIRSLHCGGKYEIFELPFCMRCPKVVVDAVGDVIREAKRLRKLKGRISKPFKHYPPLKGTDSAKYPKIAIVEMTVQRPNSNYMGQYIERAIKNIPLDEIEAARNGGYPAGLVIAVNPYREQIIDHLKSVKCAIDTGRRIGKKLDRERGLLILKEDRESNLGWRIVLSVDRPPFLTKVIAQTADRKRRLVDALPDDFRERVLADVDNYEPPEDKSDGVHRARMSAEWLPVKVTSFEGAKGISSQHVFVAGLHDKELPHNPRAIKDLEICKFIVGLTRTRKMCSLLYTDHFADRPKAASTFISWINSARLKRIRVDAAYWKRRPKVRGGVSGGRKCRSV